jgi:hypothetical protein
MDYNKIKMLAEEVERSIDKEIYKNFFESLGSTIPWQEQSPNTYSSLNYFGIINRTEIFVAVSRSTFPDFRTLTMANIAIDLKNKKYIKHRIKDNYKNAPVSEDVMLLFNHVKRYEFVWDHNVGNSRRIESHL